MPALPLSESFTRFCEGGEQVLSVPCQLLNLFINIA